MTVNGVVYSANHIEFAALGTASGLLADGGLCNSTGAWTDKVVLCQRGDISFAEKVLNVQTSGGAAAVIYNNEPGNFLGTMGEDSATIVALSLSQEDGQYLVANHLGAMGDLYAHIEQPASGYEAWGGTSMATPHVAGVAALIWSFDPALTNVEIRNAMNATAVDLGDIGRDIYFGYGLVQALDALKDLGYSSGNPSNEHPVVIISNPANSTVFDTDDEIAFSGSAMDDSDGDLSDDLVWTSDIDGIIGTGSGFSTALSAGNHTITASATDSEGETGSDFVDIDGIACPTVRHHSGWRHRYVVYPQRTELYHIHHRDHLGCWDQHSIRRNGLPEYKWHQ